MKDKAFIVLTNGQHVPMDDFISRSREMQYYASPTLQQYSDYYRKPREMTAADIFGAENYPWLTEPSDAPYAFWLGAAA